MSLKNLLPPVVFIGVGATNNLVTKLSAGNVDPHLMAFGRMAVAVVVLFPFVAGSLWLHRKAVAANIPKLAVLGLIGFGIGQSLPYVAAERLSGSTIGFLIGLIPLSTVLISRVALGEKLTALIVGGTLTSLLGLAVLLTEGNLTALLTLQAQLGWHEAVLLFAVIAYATHGVLLRLWEAPLPVATSLFIQVMFATLFLLPFSLAARSNLTGWAGTALVLYAGVAATVLAPIIWMHGINRIGPSRMANYINLIPILTTVGAILFLGEAFRWHLAIGGALIVAGVALAQRRPRPT